MVIDTNKLVQEQLKLAKKIILKDSFNDVKLIAGCDQAFIANRVISAIVVCDYKTMHVIEKRYTIKKSTIPYIPGLLSYREAPVVIEAFNKLENKPNILLVDANGILHPRKMGMASHLGVLLDVPTIGVTKSLLLGIAKDNKVFVDNEQRAIILKTREHSKPIYISPGHKISLETAVKIVKESLSYPHKLPEPLHQAHTYANKIKISHYEKSSKSSTQLSKNS